MRFDLILHIDATFKDLDQVLRDIWMGDGHVSQFHYDKLARPNYVSTE
jgi:hypothetical protein